MSLGNSYFKDDEVRFLIENIVQRFGKVVILIADVPAISTYLALGYPENRARREKAMAQGHALRNRVRKVMSQLGYSDSQVKIINWGEEVENNLGYKKSYADICNLYNENTKFMKEADNTTLKVLETFNRNLLDIKKSTKIAVHYLLSEISFLEWAPEFLKFDKVIYVYHKNWPVYEDYISGKFDKKIRKYMDFFLLENPWETYNPMGVLKMKRKKRGIILL